MDKDHDLESAADCLESALNAPDWPQCLARVHDAAGHVHDAALSNAQLQAALTTERAARERAERERDALILGGAWQPFETAPALKVIVVWRPDAGWFLAEFTSPAEATDHLPDDQKSDDWERTWFSVDGEDLTNDLPTHWMIPSDPNQHAAPPTDEDVERAVLAFMRSRMKCKDEEAAGYWATWVEEDKIAARANIRAALTTFLRTRTSADKSGGGE